MYRKILVSVCVVVFLCVSIICVYNHYTVDVKCAKKLANVLNSYSIEEMDNYLDETTEVIFMTQKAVYKNCRSNVLRAFENKEYVIPQNASYGFGNNKFEKGIQKISVRLMGTFNNKNIGECIIDMNIKRDGLFGYKVLSVKCDEAIFGYIFFGSTEPTTKTEI